LIISRCSSAIARNLDLFSFGCVYLRDGTGEVLPENFEIRSLFGVICLLTQKIELRFPFSIGASVSSEPRPVPLSRYYSTGGRHVGSDGPLFCGGRMRCSRLTADQVFIRSPHRGSKLTCLHPACRIWSCPSAK